MAEEKNVLATKTNTIEVIFLIHEILLRNSIISSNIQSRKKSTNCDENAEESRVEGCDPWQLLPKQHPQIRMALTTWSK